jgi:uncharacterized repeat protein (TIGR01451 family)
VARLTLKIALSFVVLISTASLLAPAQPTAYPLGKVAIHVVADGTSCKSLPSFDYCASINTTYIGTGDVDIIPVFFDLVNYSAVEFGLSWPPDWGTCSFVPCGTGTVLGSICNPGDGIVMVWPTCQNGYSVPVGYGWLTARSSGRVDLIDSPWSLGHRIGFTDCGQTFYPPVVTFSAGIGWIEGDEPCRLARTPLIVEISDDASGSCVRSGDTLRFSIHITNVNSYAVHDVVLVDSLPPGTLYLSGGTYDEQTRVMRLELGTIELDEAWAAFALQITAPAGSTLTNHFAVLSRELCPRPATHSKQVCSGSATDGATWGQIKAIFR